MSFTSNTSAFGLKPATTSVFGQSNTGGAFGSSTPAQSTSAFGSFGQSQAANTQQQQQQPSLFGQPAQAQQQSMSLFGQNNNNNNQQSTAPSLFGQNNQQQQQQQPSSSLFGQPNQQQQQPAPTSAFGGGSSLFGQSSQPAAPTGSTSLFGQPTTGGTSLFGSANTNTTQPGATNSLFGGQSTTSTGSSLFGGNSAFGQNNQNQQNQQGGGGSLFGTSTNTGSSLFGNSTFGQNNTQNPTQQQQGGGSLFGNQSNAFGGSLFNKPQQSVAPSQNAGSPLFTKTTKFNDLPDQLKKQFEDIESYIQGRVQISKELAQRKLGEEPTKSQEQLRSFHKELVNTISIIRADIHHTKDLKAKTDQAVEDTITSMRIIDAHKSQQANHTHLRDHASFPYEFFKRLSEQMKERLAWCKSTSEQIERKLASMAHQSQYTPQGISTTLQAQHSSFLALASKTAVLDAELQKIKGLYTQLWRQKTGSVRDPFNELDSDRNVGSSSKLKGDLGMSGLNVR